MRLVRPAAVLFTLAAAGAASAQTWIQRIPGDWLNSANWSTGTAPNGSGAAASIVADTAGGSLEFSGTFTAAGNITLGELSLNFSGSPLSTDIAVEQIDFINGGSPAILFARGGGLIEISAPIRLGDDLVADWQANNGLISGSIQSRGGITLDAPLPSRLRLRGVNSYEGATDVVRGTLSISSDVNLGDPEAGTTVREDGTLVLDNTGPETYDGDELTLENGTLSLQQGANWAADIALSPGGLLHPSFDGQAAEISGHVSGGRFIRESSAINLNPDVESLLLLTNPANDYTGGTIIRAGILAVPSDDVLGDPTEPVIFNNPDVTDPLASEGVPALLTTENATIARDLALNSPGSLRALDGTTAIYTGDITSTGPLGPEAMNIGGPAGPDFVGDPGLNDWTGTVVFRTANTYEGDTVVHSGTLLVDNSFGSPTGTGTVVVKPNAGLGGTGPISGLVDMTEGGILRPGAPIGAAGTFQSGGITMGPNALTIIEIDGSAPGEFDRIVNSTTTTVDGQLFIQNTANPPLSPGDEFEIVLTPALVGTFENVTGATSGDFVVEYNFNSVVLVYQGPPCPADLSGDNMVGADDLAELIAGWGQSGVPGDFSGDGVGADDLAALIAAWGACPYSG